jgi:hypothetical protein
VFSVSALIEIEGLTAHVILTSVLGSHLESGPVASCETSAPANAAGKARLIKCLVLLFHSLRLTKLNLMKSFCRLGFVQPKSLKAA